MLHPLRPDGFIEPCQPIGAAKPPSGAGWLHEIKLDGFRLMAQRRGVGGRLLTRNGNDWNERYPSVVAALYALKVKSCLIDGEITVAMRRALRSSTCCATAARSSPRRCGPTQKSPEDLASGLHRDRP